MSSYICEDVMLNIFQRLPPKIVVQCRCLSRSWRSCLASPDFISAYNLRSLNDPTRERVLVRQRVHDDGYKDIYTLHLRDRELSLDQDYGYSNITGIELPSSDYRIVGSCNGIICLLTSREFSLCNFSIRRKFDVARHPYSNESTVSGFGFDPLSKDYKIVCISSTHNDYNLFIYSLKTNSWNVIAPPTIPFYTVQCNACCFNEKLHWVVLTGDGSSHIILTFSLTTHAFGTIELPEDISGVRQLTIINGSLAVISWADDHTWVWLMSQSNNAASWLTLYKYETKFCDDVRVFQPVSNGDLLIYDKGREVYNPRKHLFTEFLEFGPCHGLEVERYVETFELLDKTDTFGKTIFSLPIKKNHKRKFSSLGYDDDDVDDDDDGNKDDDDVVDVGDAAAKLIEILMGIPV